MGKKFQKQNSKFGKDFSVKKSKKTKKLTKKNKKSNVFRKKKDFLIIFLIRIFSWKTDKLDQKLAKSVRNICLRDIENFGGENNVILRI